jgi:hypothetical protein
MHAFKPALVVLALAVASFGCNSSDDPTSPSTSCTRDLTGTRSWIIRGGCEGSVSSDQHGTGTATFSTASCTLVMDVTPAAVKTAGGSWTMTADLRNGSATVVRANTDCPGTDTGTVRVDTTSVIATVLAPANSACSCRLAYTVNVALPG